MRIVICGRLDYITTKPPGFAFPAVVVASARRGVHIFIILCDNLEKPCSRTSRLIVYVYQHKEAKTMHHYNDAELDFTALTAFAALTQKNKEQVNAAIQSLYLEQLSSRVASCPLSATDLLTPR